MLPDSLQADTKRESFMMDVNVAGVGSRQNAANSEQHARAPQPMTTSNRPSTIQPKAENVLVTEQLVKIYGGRAVVDGVNLQVKAGEIVGLLGPNGAGKTTSFYMIVGLVRPNSGRVIFSGTDVTNYPMYKRARLGMGYLPHEVSIFRKLTVE